MKLYYSLFLSLSLLTMFSCSKKDDNIKPTVELTEEEKKIEALKLKFASSIPELKNYSYIIESDFIEQKAVLASSDTEILVVIFKKDGKAIKKELSVPKTLKGIYRVGKILPDKTGNGLFYVPLMKLTKKPEAGAPNEVEQILDICFFNIYEEQINFLSFTKTGEETGYFFGLVKSNNKYISFAQGGKYFVFDNKGNKLSEISNVNSDLQQDDCYIATPQEALKIEITNGSVALQLSLFKIQRITDEKKTLWTSYLGLSSKIASKPDVHLSISEDNQTIDLELSYLIKEWISDTEYTTSTKKTKASINVMTGKITE